MWRRVAEAPLHSETAKGRRLPEDFSETAEGRSLPEDLIVKILVKLSVKSLLRCRCVCKTWYDLIKSTNFVNMHLDYRKSNGNFLILWKSGTELRSVMSPHSFESPEFSYPHLDLRPDSYLCGSCDGLVCLLNWESNVLILCNPELREFRQLPHYPFRCKDGGKCLTRAVGLGFASITNDYKVIAKVMLHGNMFEEKTIVYNLSTNSWREITCSTPFKVWMGSEHRGTLFGGALHWVDQRQGKIISFNVNTEVFSDLELPRIYCTNRSKRNLTIFNGSLALLTYECPEPHCIDIWVMHKYGVKESWTKQLTVGLGRMRYFYPVLLWKNEAIILKTPSFGVHLVSLGSHETNSSYVEEIQCDVGQAMVYSESLISIK